MALSVGTGKQKLEECGTFDDLAKCPNHKAASK